MIDEENALLESFIQRWRELEDEPHPQLRQMPINEFSGFDRISSRPLPTQFMHLLTHWYWQDEVWFDSIRLLESNDLGSLNGFIDAVCVDKILFSVLKRNGFVQFARATDGQIYDPICFDIRSRSITNDYPIVRLDHEEILQHERIKVVARVADHFDELLQQIVKIETTNGRAG